MTITDKDYEEGVKKLAEQYGYEDTEEFISAYGGEDAMRQALLQEKVGNYLVENCVQLEPKTEE